MRNDHLQPSHPTRGGCSKIVLEGCVAWSPLGRLEVVWISTPSVHHRSVRMPNGATGISRSRVTGVTGVSKPYYWGKSALTVVDFCIATYWVTCRAGRDCTTMHYGVLVPRTRELDRLMVAWSAKLDGLAAEADRDAAVLAARSEERCQQATHYRDMRVLFEQVVAEVCQLPEDTESEEVASEDATGGGDRSVRRMAQRGEVKHQLLRVMRLEPRRGWRPKELADALGPMTTVAYVRALVRVLVRSNRLMQDEAGLYRIPGLTVVADDAAARDREVAM